MSVNPTIRQQIDACRAGSNDLTSPAMAELADALKHDPAAAEELARSQRMDEQVRSALHDLPVPASLAERLLAAVRSNQPSAEATLAADSRVRRFPRRRWLIVAALTTAALLLLAALPLFRSRRGVSQQQLAADVTVWLSNLQPKAWQPVGKLPHNVALDPAVIAKPQQWQGSMANTPAWSSSVVAIDLMPPGAGSRAILFAVTTPARVNVPTRPVATAWLTLSGGFTGIAWQRQGSSVLFVLAVEDRNLPLERFVRIGSEA